MDSVKQIFLIVILASLAFNAKGQINDIEFKSEFEKEILTNPDDHSEIEILLAISDNNSTGLSEKVRSEIRALKTELSNKRFENKTDEKKLKLLFELTHKKFFLKYKEISNFDKIFETKEYNCVSATALYCLILDEYSIPYSIKETPTHVYLVAYPQTKNIVLESTAPKSGYYSPDNRDIQKAVSTLVELKYYTKEEIESKGIRKVYDEFFFSKDEIDVRKLAGLQYYNEAISYYSEEKYKEALNSNYKSQILYPSEKTEYLSFVFLANILNKTGYDRFDNVKYLAQYANLSIVDKDEIINAYNTIINKRLFAESNYSLMDSIYSYLMKNLTDSMLIQNISEVHFAGFSRFYTQKSDFNKSLEYSSKAYKLNPDNVNTQSLISQSLIQDLGRRTGSPSTIKKLNDYLEKFPFLNENSLYQLLYFYTYSHNAFNHFRADDIDKGLEYLKLIESLIEKYGEELKYDEDKYGLIYAEAGAAYFRERRYREAKKIIEKGLSIMPDHPELKVRLEIVIDEMN